MCVKVVCMVMLSIGIHRLTPQQSWRSQWFFRGSQISIGQKNQIFIILAVLRLSIIITSGGIHFRGSALGQHSSEKTS